MHQRAKEMPPASAATVSREIFCYEFLRHIQPLRLKAPYESPSQVAGSGFADRSLMLEEFYGSAVLPTMARR
jgi:hypothetical protein